MPLNKETLNSVLLERDRVVPKKYNLKLVNLVQTNEILLIENSTYLNIRFKILGWICIYAYIDRIWRWITNKGWYAIKPNQPTNQNSASPVLSIIVGVFAKSPGVLGSISCWVIPKTQKMVLDASLLNTQYYKVRIKGKVEKSREMSSAIPYTSV